MLPGKRIPFLSAGDNRNGFVGDEPLRSGQLNPDDIRGVLERYNPVSGQ